MEMISLRMSGAVEAESGVTRLARARASEWVG